MILFLSWIVLSLMAAFIGQERKIGFSKTLLLSIILSPLIGIIVALASQRKSEAEVNELIKEKIELEKLKNKSHGSLTTEEKAKLFDNLNKK